MRTSILLAAAWIAVAAAGQQPRIPSVLQDVPSIKKIELYSLSPPYLDEATLEMKWKHPDKPKFRSEWSILGQTSIDDAGEIKDILSAVHSAIRESERKVVNCFLPAHALRIYFRDESVYDIPICFHCLRLEIYKKDENERLASAAISGKWLAQFDGFLQKHQLPLDTDKP